MKKIYLTFLIAAFASATWAQDAQEAEFHGLRFQRILGQLGNFGRCGSRYGVRRTAATSKSFGDRIGFEGNFSLTKWVHPVVGLRAQLQGGSVQ